MAALAMLALALFAVVAVLLVLPRDAGGPEEEPEVEDVSGVPLPRPTDSPVGTSRSDEQDSERV